MVSVTLRSSEPELRSRCTCFAALAAAAWLSSAAALCLALSCMSLCTCQMWVVPLEQTVD
jgi:hypothetical protein